MTEDRWHQKITVTLKPEEPQLLSDLEKKLLSLEFVSTDDGEIYSFPRNDKVEIWQTEDIVHVRPTFNGEEASFGHECFEKWDTLELFYLLPWLPIDHVNIFLTKVNELAEILHLETLHQGKLVKLDDLNIYINKCANELKGKMEEPGGEFLAQAIHMDLPV